MISFVIISLLVIFNSNMFCILRTFGISDEHVNISGLSSSHVKDSEPLSFSFLFPTPLAPPASLPRLHFQKSPFQQSKLVRVSNGEIQDIIVDIRKGSSTFGKYISVILSKENQKQIFIPKGFAHGFLTLSKSAVVNYKVDNYYSSEHDSGILFKDSDIGISWNINEPDIIVSKKDSNLSALKEL